jgi:hypothetical protein
MVSFFSSIDHVNGSGINEKNIAFLSYQKAIQLQRDNRLGDALRELDKAVALDPDMASYRIARGNLYLLTGNPVLAILDYKEWTRIDPKSDSAYGELGKAFEANKDYDSAIGAYSTAISLDPRNSLYYYGRADSLQEKNKLWDALGDYKEAVKLLTTSVKYPWNLLIYEDLSAIYFRLGYIQEAIKIYKEKSDMFQNDIGHYPFNLQKVQEDTPIQIGKQITDFIIELPGGPSISKQDLIGVSYVLFRWEPVFKQTTLNEEEWANGPMDALIIEDDKSIMLDTFVEIRKKGVKPISIANKPLAKDPEGQILRARSRSWPLYELPADNKSWLGTYDYSNWYRVLFVDENGVIQLALLSKDYRQIRNTILWLLDKTNVYGSTK